MLVKVNTVITDYKGEEVKNGAGVLTYRDVFENALNTVEADEKLDGSAKAKLYVLTCKLYDDKKGEVHLAAEDIVCLKERVAKFYNPMIVGRVNAFLDDSPKAA